MKSKVLRTHVRSDYSVETASKLKEYFIDDVNDGLRNLIKLRNAFGPNFNGIKRGLFSTLGLSNHYSDPTNVYNYLYYANQLNYAWFQFVMNDGKPITLQIANRTIETVGQFKNEGIGAANVIAGIQTALILRDQKALNFYAQIPLEFTGQANQQDMVVETMLLFYQVLIRGTGNQNEANSTYRELVNQLNWDEYQRYVVKDDFYSPSVWKIIHGYRTQEINYLLIPVLFVYHQILHQNQSGYEQAVYDALIKWKEYYTLSYVDENKEDRDHSIDPAGYLALPIAAACAYAYDKGMKLETVQSDYIPAWMVEGRFDGFNLLVRENA